MNHEKTFEAINKLKEVELELHRLKNALERANKALDAQRQWVGLTDEERKNIMVECESTGDWAWELKAAQAIEAKLKQKNTWQDGNCKHCTDGCPACDARRQSNVLP